MVKVASFTRYDVRTDRMLQPSYKKLVQALRPDEGYVMIKGTEEDVPLSPSTMMDDTILIFKSRRTNLRASRGGIRGMRDFRRRPYPQQRRAELRITVNSLRPDDERQRATVAAGRCTQSC